MNSVATDPRRRLQITLRRLRYAASELPQRLWSQPTTADTIGLLSPAGTSAGDGLVRLAWSAPEHSVLIVDSESNGLTPEWVGPDLPDVTDRIRFGDPAAADVVVLSDASGLRWIRRATSGRVLIGDPSWYGGVEVEGHARLSSLATSEQEWASIRSQSHRLLSDLVERYKGADRVAVFGTGPSMTSIDPDSIGADVTIACNSAVSNAEWMAAAKPAVVTFGDPVFHFGPSRYASRFRSDLMRFAASGESLFAIPERFAPLLRRRMPELSDRTIAVGHRSVGPLDSLSADNLFVRGTANILTLLMLPVALTLGSHVAIAGCDGRRPTERYFWTHNRDAQYGDDLMSTAFRAHPSFFRDRDYESYYNSHCEQLESMLTDAESRGFSFESITSSAIPALARRFGG